MPARRARGRPRRGLARGRRARPRERPAAAPSRARRARRTWAGAAGGSLPVAAPRPTALSSARAASATAARPSARRRARRGLKPSGFRSYLRYCRHSILLYPNLRPNAQRSARSRLPGHACAQRVPGLSAVRPQLGTPAASAAAHAAAERSRPKAQQPPGLAPGPRPRICLPASRRDPRVVRRGWCGRAESACAPAVVRSGLARGRAQRQAPARRRADEAHRRGPRAGAHGRLRQAGEGGRVHRHQRERGLLPHAARVRGPRLRPAPTRRSPPRSARQAGGPGLRPALRDWPAALRPTRMPSNGLPRART